MTRKRASTPNMVLNIKVKRRFILEGKEVDEWLEVRAGDLARAFGDALARWAFSLLAAELRRELRGAGIFVATGIFCYATYKKEERSAASTLSCALLAGHWTVS